MRQPMQSALSCMVMPSGVLYIAFGETGQALTHGASVQWLHSTGSTRCVTFGNVPSVCIMKSAQLKLWPLPRVRVLFSALQANAQAPQPTQRSQVDDHSEVLPSWISFSSGCEFRLSRP